MLTLLFHYSFFLLFLAESLFSIAPAGFGTTAAKNGSKIFHFIKHNSTNNIDISFRNFFDFLRSFFKYWKLRIYIFCFAKSALWQWYSFDGTSVTVSYIFRTIITSIIFKYLSPIRSWLLFNYLVIYYLLPWSSIY